MNIDDLYNKLSDNEIIIIANYLISEWDIIKGKLRLCDISTHAVNNSENKYLKNYEEIHDQSWSVNTSLGV